MHSTSFSIPSLPILFPATSKYLRVVPTLARPSHKCEKPSSLILQNLKLRISNFFAEVLTKS